MRESFGGKRVGLTLRVDRRVLAVYSRIAVRANAIRVRHGERGDVTAQDIMRHRLESLPILKKRQVKGEE